MKENITQLLEELLLEQTAGGWDSVDNSINLAISLYCEIVNINEQKFREKLKMIKDTVWGDYRCLCDLKAHEETQKKYQTFIKILLER